MPELIEFGLRRFAGIALKIATRGASSCTAPSTSKIVTRMKWAPYRCRKGHRYRRERDRTRRSRRCTRAVLRAEQCAIDVVRPSRILGRHASSASRRLQGIARPSLAAPPSSPYRLRYRSCNTGPCQSPSLEPTSARSSARGEGRVYRCANRAGLGVIPNLMVDCMHVREG
jgi:hypothetical protein